MGNLNTGRIAKNTVMLYIRMLLILGVSLYTSRVVLQVLGVSDYGVYSLIAGILTMFSFVSQSLVEAMQRFFNVAIGRGDTGRLVRTYVMGINLFALFSVFLLLVGETLGLWYILHEVNVPPGREHAALWVYQISLATLIVQLFRTPDNALIIAHERMTFYAYLGILEAVLKLSVVLVLRYFSCDRLILFTLLYLATSVLINILYRIYCHKYFSTVRYRYLWDRALLKEMVSFSGWTVLNGGTRTMTLQFENIFLNRFYSVAVNAARGVASQVYNAVNLFLTNFQTAFQPQLVKTYAAGEREDHQRLLYQSSRFSYYLFLLLFIPIIFNLEELLSLWLVEVPEYTVPFCKYVMLAYLADALAHPLTTSIMANGNIRGIQISTSVVFVIQLAASFFSLRAGAPPYIVSVFILVSHTIHYFLYLYYSRKLCGIGLSGYFRQVIRPILVVSSLAVVLPLSLRRFSGGLFSTLGICCTDLIWISAVVWLVGLKRAERLYLRAFVISKFQQKSKS